MRSLLIAAVAGSALTASLLTPVVHASSTPESSTDSADTRMSGEDCEWGTEPAQVIPQVDYPRGYLFGGDWRRDNSKPPEECVIGPAWTPLRHNYPFARVEVNSAVYGGEDVDSHLCTGIADPSCSPTDWPEIYAEATVGHCESGADFNCVESLDVISPDGTEAPARYQRGFPEWSSVPEFDNGDIFMPAGGAVPLWEYDTPTGTAQILSVGMAHAVFRSINGRWAASSPPALFSFGLRPVAIQSRPGIPRPTLVEAPDSTTGATKVFINGLNDPAAIGCAAIDAGQCAIDAEFPDGFRYRVTLRLHDESAMYLNGAVDTPVAYSEEIPGGHSFVLEANPMPVLGLAGWIPKSWIPRSVVDGVFDELGFDYNWNLDVYATSYHGLGRGGEQALAWLKVLLPYFGDRASFVTEAWYVETTTTLGKYTDKCVDRGGGEFIGIVSSNATAYTGDPPTYNPATSTLSYEIAGPHYMPDGTTLSRGRYAINMNANFVKCLLGVDKVPSVARVELIYPDGEASAATLALKQDENWLRLTYENFTFSSPTVSVKFPKSLTCVKGKGKKAKTKQVVAFKCPKGWKARR